MNVGKSVKQALLDKDKNQKWLVEKLNSSPAVVSHYATTKHCSGTVINKLANAFEMTSSEFIALGED